MAENYKIINVNTHLQHGFSYVIITVGCKGKKITFDVNGYEVTKEEAIAAANALCTLLNIACEVSSVN